MDRLAKRRLPHPAACPLCGQAEDTIQHVLTLCVFSWQVWSLILQKWGLITIAPQQTASCFSSWWCSALKGVPQKLQNVLDFLIILEAWEIWKHKSDYVFNGARPGVPAVLWTVANDSPSGVRLEWWHFRNCYLCCLPWLINFLIGVSWSTTLISARSAT